MATLKVQAVLTLHPTSSDRLWKRLSVQQLRVSTSVSSPVIISFAVARVSRRAKQSAIAFVAALNSLSHATWAIAASAVT